VDGVTLHLGDALEILKGLPSASVDSVITDPPYCSGGSLEAQKNTGLQGVRTSNRSKEDFRWFHSDNMTTGGLVWLLRSMMVEAARLLKPDRSALVFTDWRMVPQLAPALESCGMRWRNLIVWDKGSTGLGTGFRPCHEMLLEFVSGSNLYYTRDGSNVIRTRRVCPGERDHQAQKPAELLAALIKTVCPPGGVVLDPFMGSGTTGVACLMTGRRFVGCEVDPYYHATAETRLKAAAGEDALFAQPGLFPEAS
jgi:DNA modification methylase